MSAQIVDPVSLVVSPPVAEAALQLLSDAEHAKLTLLAEEFHAVLGEARPLLAKPLEDAPAAHRLNNLLGRGAKTAKELEALRKARVEPLNREVKNVNAVCKAISDQLDSLRSAGERLIIAFNRQEEARRQREADEARRRQEEAARKEAEALAALSAARDSTAREAALVAAEAASREQTAALLAEPAAAPRAYKSDEATTSIRAPWVFSIVKPESLPREFLMPNPQAIKAAVAGGAREIPGVCIYQEESLTVRAR